ncbi:MAG: valine--tRNA ligase [Caldiserica bacterium]|jgi:valyl-tRNA synthetase|nr:valine--tRNA ligase [Caldisericota bacterium]MDH7562136.1 valine--tRNA ligase [Caldisericota bacterium]
MNIPTAYEPKEVEKRIYQFWLEGNYFRAEIDPSKKPAVIAMPPPNVYGSLHVGHGFNNTLQDLIIRFWRMSGWNALWIPGLDHAGLAFQNAVEKELRKEGLSRFDLGREEFLKRCWKWKEEQASYVVEQLKMMGASADWSRLRFTMDEGYQRAVRRQFIQLFNDGLIYRGRRIINWCPTCLTALSDIEVEYEEERTFLYFVRYPLEGENGFITVATTRPETMLGDTAVAVHPEDQRYKDLVGKTAILPLMNRRIPIISDSEVDPEFGTGAVKITPAHDPLDYEIGQRHSLPSISVIGEGGLMTQEAGEFSGLDRLEARKQIVKKLEEGGFLQKVEPYSHSIGKCYRCHQPIEPLISTQWFVKMKPLAIPAMKVVESGEIKFHPERWKKVYMEWMENIKDWCISRQIWWGHRIPVWYCQSCGEVFASEEEPETCPRCRSNDLKQDPDALDTWFSSNLWPFAILGWPEETEDLRYFFPTTVLSTGYDIIFFWVARMIMASLYFTGKIPFSHVYIHGLIRDGKGRKMSRSLGNVIDPLEKMEQYGTDAFRFAMAASATLGGQDIPMGEERFERGRNFTNKLWNASRFLLLNLEGFDPQAKPLNSLPHRYILSLLSRVIDEATRDLEEFNFADFAHTLEDFFWGEFCDWYIEMCKTDLNMGGDRRKGAQTLLHRTLETILRLLHPICPFITEELWQKLPGKEGEALIVAPWPKPEASDLDEEAERRMEFLKAFVRTVRNLRAEGGLPPSSLTKAIVLTTPEIKEILEESLEYILPLARISGIEFREEQQRPKGAIGGVAPGMEIFLPLNPKEREGLLLKLKKETEKLRADLGRVESRISNPEFLEKAPPDVLEKQQKSLEDLRFRLERARKIFQELGGE